MSKRILKNIYSLQLHSTFTIGCDAELQQLLITSGVVQLEIGATLLAHGRRNLFSIAFAELR